MHKKQNYLTIILFIAQISQNSFADNAEQNSSKQWHTDEPITNLRAAKLASCSAQYTTVINHTPPRTFAFDNKLNTEISAHKAHIGTHIGADRSITLEGNVIIERDLLRIATDHASYNKQRDELRLIGNVHIDSINMALSAADGIVNINTDSEQHNTQGEFNKVKFIIANSKMKGKAETIHLSGQVNNNQISTLYHAGITSCNLMDPDWLISADEIRLDHVDEYGSADDVVIRFKGIPFLYTPYIEFPTSDKRRSGLLFPEIGSSSSRGVEIAVPWYWNIAPNHDAVITPRNMVKRGLELSGEYRFLTQSSNGELKAAYLPDDNITQEDRYQLRYQQHTRFLPNLLLDIDFQELSDADYFNDFSNNLGSTSQTHLFRNATLAYDLNNWRIRALVQDIKTIDTSTPISSRPYERLPQLTFNGDTEITSGPLLFTLDSEFVDFAHEDDTKITGSRFTLRPGLRLPLSGTAWFIEPAIKFSHTQYNVGIEGNATTPGTSQSVKNRNLPMSSIDAGLFFERYFDNGYVQTLEPRLYYLNVPFEDQSSTPIFDTSTPEFSVAQLFRDNQFVGGDRIGDANQLTFSLTSRIINPNTGNEFLRASIGQIFYFKDRQVSLNNTTDTSSIDTSKQSDIIAELDTNWGHWQSNIDLQWDTTNNELSKENYFLHYRSDARHLFNMGYRKRLLKNSSSRDIEQTDTSFVYAINREYSVIARWNYSLKDKKHIDAIAGLAYDSCCWSIQLLAQRRLKNTTGSTTTDDDDYDNSILVQFIFKGLGSLSGSTARTTLEQSIYSYTDIFQ